MPVPSDPPIQPVYLDHAASSPMRHSAIEALTAALPTVGNPSSIHTQGQRAKQLVEESREQVAASVGADAVEVVFTGGGTEAVNAAVKGLYWARQRGGARPRILVPMGEHHATLDSVEWLAEHDGAVVEWLPIDADGTVDLGALERALAVEPGADVALVTLLLANNEVGTVQPAADVVRLAAAHGVPVHVDAIAAYGQVPIDFHALGAAAMSLSAHKIGGPVAAGALVLRRDATVTPLLHGGGQQRRIRSGTMDAASAAAFAAAATEAAAGLAAHAAALAALRDRMIDGIRRLVPDAVLRGPDPAAVLADGTPARLPGNVHITVPGAQGDSLLFLLDAAGISVSTGSACQAGVPEISHVLTGMGLSDDVAVGALRMTLGHDSTPADVDAFLAALPAAVAGARRAGLS